MSEILKPGAEMLENKYQKLAKTLKKSLPTAFEEKVASYSSLEDWKRDAEERDTVPVEREPFPIKQGSIKDMINEAKKRGEGFEHVLEILQNAEQDEQYETNYCAEFNDTQFDQVERYDPPFPAPEGYEWRVNDQSNYYQLAKAGTEKAIYEEIETSYGKGPSYYWLVKFDNGQRIPYPLMNQEGPDASAYKHGGMGRSEEEKKTVVEQEALIKKAFEEKPELKQKFEEIKAEIFEQKK